MLDWELGDVTVWLSIDNSKPFPVNIYKHNNEWTYKVHRDDLSDRERVAIEGFFKDMMSELTQQWRPHLKRRLTWDASKLGRKKK